MPRDLIDMKGLDWMRTCALLAVYGIQVGRIDVMHQYLGLYSSLVSMDSLHDEKNWPKNIGIVEIELRRRLVSCYHFPSIQDLTSSVLVHVLSRSLFFNHLGWHRPM